MLVVWLETGGRPLLPAVVLEARALRDLFGLMNRRESSAARNRLTSVAHLTLVALKRKPWQSCRLSLGWLASARGSRLGEESSFGPAPLWLPRRLREIKL
ncbi:hypothetical protein MTO96_010682 [Rhipicephalus appendiculatus]